MTTKHAPGPWEVTTTGPALRYVIKADSTSIATLFENVDHEGSAHLIAAAPDLLAALEMLNEAAQGHVQLNNDWVEKVTRAAIAKARGE